MSVEAKKELDVFTQYEYLVDESYSSMITEYCGAWVDDCINNAFFNMSRPEGVMKPHALTMAMFGGKMSKNDFFKIEKRSSWRMRCFVFKDNESLSKWMAGVGEDIVIHHVFV